MSADTIKFDKDTMERHSVASQSAYIRSKDARQNYMDKYYNGEYTLLDDYSGRHHTGYRHNSTGDIIYAVRGTDYSDAVNSKVKDLATDVLVTFGLETLGNRYKSSDKMLKRLLEENKNSKITLAGHSLGGTISQELAYKYDLPSHTFASGASPISANVKKHRFLHPKNKEKKNKNHTYLTIPTGIKGFDPISLSNYLHPFTSVHWVQQKKLKKSEQGVLSAHSINHFHPKSAVM